MASDRITYRLGLRSSSAAQPHRNHAREAKTGQAPWDQEDFRDAMYGEEIAGEEEND